MIKSRWWSDEELLEMAVPRRVVKCKTVNVYKETKRMFSEDFQTWMEVSEAQGLKFTDISLGILIR